MEESTEKGRGTGDSAPHDFAPSEETAARIRRGFIEDPGCFSWCQKCGMRVEGTMEQILAHKCLEPDGQGQDSVLKAA